jgi:hypothetical protein
MTCGLCARGRLVHLSGLCHATRLEHFGFLSTSSKGIEVWQVLSSFFCMKKACHCITYFGSACYDRCKIGFNSQCALSWRPEDMVLGASLSQRHRAIQAQWRINGARTIARNAALQLTKCARIVCTESHDDYPHGRAPHGNGASHDILTSRAQAIKAPRNIFRENGRSNKTTIAIIHAARNSHK